MANRIQALEKENAQLKKITDELRSLVLSLDSRVKSLEGSTGTTAASKPAAAPQPAKPAAKDDDDDVDLFGSDEEDEEAERIKQERVAAYAAKKSNSKFFHTYLHFIKKKDTIFTSFSRAGTYC